MPKSRKKKVPVTNTQSGYSAKSVSGHHLIRRFHVLLKRRDRLLAETVSTTVRDGQLEDVQREIESLGGLEAYQKTSARGQSEERGGGSEKIFVKWLIETGAGESLRGKAGKASDKGKLALLEVGAVKPDNYASHAAWLDCTPIDLHSRHPLIKEQDFLEMDVLPNRSIWDAISLSLVVNFVPNPRDRGRMLHLAHSFLREGGYLFLATYVDAWLQNDEGEVETWWEDGVLVVPEGRRIFYQAGGLTDPIIIQEERGFERRQK